VTHCVCLTGLTECASCLCTQENCWKESGKEKASGRTNDMSPSVEGLKGGGIVIGADWPMVKK
jgi:hypothetical protein